MAGESIPNPTPMRPAGGAPTSVAGQGGTSSKDLEQAITVLRMRIDEEFRITERLDSKARQAFALAAGFFAVVQTVTFGGFAQGDVSSPERVGLLVAAVVAGVGVIVVAHRLTGSEGLLDEDDVTPEAIVQWCNAAGEDPEYVSVRLVGELSRMARSRSKNNEVRTTRYDTVALAARWSLILAGVELLVAIVVRL